MAGGGLPISVTTVEGGFLTGRKLVFPLFLVISLFFLWGFSYGLLDVLNSHFQTVLGITKLQSTGLQVMYFGGGYFFFSPVAAEVLKRKGYKITILMGLSFYSVGAVMFWPTAHFSTYDNRLAAFGGFLVCTLVIACGLATLETAANSYAVVIGDPASASSRLQFCQAWNGVASFIGPLIASKFFFTGANASNLTNVQYVYLAVSCAGIAVAILFAVSKLPEVAESDLQSGTENFEDGQVGQGPIYKQYNMIFGFLAQFCYVGSQVTIGAFFINYALEAGYDKPTSSNMLSYALIIFTVGRFFAFALSWIFQADFLLIVYAIFAIVFNGVVCADAKKTGVPVLMLLYFFEAPMYPTIFTLGTANLGRHTRRGAGILVMGVAGGAVFPPIQGAIADAANTRISMVVPLAGFVYVLGYVTYHWLTHGRHIMRVKQVIVPGSQGTVDATVDGTVDPIYIDVEKAKEAGVHVEEL